ncbi:hypothetical protein ACFYMW_39120 [Streptomyces sp. NPDC006692]|uniref:hypothetical protein n=1 Tax=unclassified Streptomyces TaxID=2593676 RepID=UPI003674933C
MSRSEGVFTALEKSGHYAAMMVALVGMESRMRAGEDSVALEFCGDRGTDFMQGDVSVSYVSCGLQVSVEHAPVSRWFLALGALGSVGAVGGDLVPAAPGAPQWSWCPGGQGLVAGLWGGSLDVGYGLDCSVRIQPDRRRKSPDTEVTAAFSVVPDLLKQREAAWELGVRFLGALCSGDPAWTAKAATRRMVEQALARCAAYDEACRNGGRSVPASPSVLSMGSADNVGTGQQG